ncbi:MAG: GNAT family N-acetyltransferase [Caldilineaceae bacterium]
MQRVTGIGGVFFKTEQPKELQAWYQKHLGLPADEEGTVIFRWREYGSSFRLATTVWAPFPTDTDYFGPGQNQLMVNYRVDNLREMLAQLRESGVEVLDRVEETKYGIFGWIVDPAGNRVELWQPPAYEVPTAETVIIDRSAPVSLREVTKENLRDVMRLSVGDHQQGFVASNAVSLAQAHFEEYSWYRAVYADETPVGFVMIADRPEIPEYYLWRFMIDKRYQHLGFGKQAIQLLIEHVRTRPKATELLVSCVPGDGSPCPFYQKLGFVHTGNEHDGEMEMKLTL